MPRMRLVILLLVLLALEAAGGAGLYANNRPAAASPAAPTTAPATAQHLGAVTASPALLLAGRRAVFTSQIDGLKSSAVLYRLQYANGSQQVGGTTTDVAGFSSHSFILKYLARRGTEQVTVTVLSHGAPVAATRFDVLLPVRH